MITKSKALRILNDLLTELGEVHPDRPLAMAKTKIEEALFWLRETDAMTTDRKLRDSQRALEAWEENIKKSEGKK